MELLPSVSIVAEQKIGLTPIVAICESRKMVIGPKDERARPTRKIGYSARESNGEAEIRRGQGFFKTGPLRAGVPVSPDAGFSADR